ncbi:ABC transporter permease, partial [Candidatus Phytoplasma phoenicium]
MKNFLINFYHVLKFREPGMYPDKQPYLILKGLLETLKLTLSATIISVIIGLLLGLFLYSLQINKNYRKTKIYFLINFIFNSLIAPPFLPLSLLVIKCFLGAFFDLYHGFKPSLICLLLVLIPIFARNCEQVFLEMDPNLYETSYTLGANKFQFIKEFVLKETRSAIILKIISIFVSCLSYATILGVIGGGGLGNIVISYGYNSTLDSKGQFSTTDLIIVCVLINLILV